MFRGRQGRCLALKSLSHTFFVFILIQGHCFIAFWRERKRERKGDKRDRCKRNTSIGCPHLPRTRDQTQDPGICPDQESNLQPSGYKMTLQPTESHQPGLSHYFNNSLFCENLLFFLYTNTITPQLDYGV